MPKDATLSNQRQILANQKRILANQKKLDRVLAKNSGEVTRKGGRPLFPHVYSA
jgi:hypothetical protein